MNTFLANWKTSVAGLLIMFGKFLESYDPTHTKAAWHIGVLAQMLGAMLLGAAAIDANQSKIDGGTISGVVKMLMVLLMLFATLQFILGCVTSTEGLSKDQIKEQATKREARNERIWAVGEGVGNLLVNLGTNWLTAKSSGQSGPTTGKPLPNDQGLRK